MAMKTVTIHSDGTGPGTVIIDENGNKLNGVIEATIRLAAGDYNTVDLEIIAPEVQITAAVDETSFLCPICEEYQSHQCQPNTLSGT